MPRNRSEKGPQYSPTVTAWLIAWHRFMILHDISSTEESTAFGAMSIQDQAHWSTVKGSILDPIVKQVYDATQSK